MTVTAKSSRKVIVGAGWANPLTHDFVLENASYVHVYADSVELVGGVDYVVSNVLNPAGYVVTIVTPGSWAPTEWVLNVVMPMTQEKDLTVGGTFGAKFEEGLDKTTRRLQYVYDLARRAVKSPIGTTVGVSYDLPEPAAGEVIGWDDTATELENKTLLELGAAVVSDDATLAGASHVNVPTQYAVKTYVDAKAVTSLAKVVNVFQYGAVGDGVADDQPAFAAAYAAAKALGAATSEGACGHVWAPPGYKYKFGASLSLDVPVKLTVDGEILYTPTTGAAVIIGSTLHTARGNTQYDIKLGVVRSVNGNAVAPTGINTAGTRAVEIRDMQFSKVSVEFAIAFTHAGIWANCTNNVFTGQHVQDNNIYLGEAAYCGAGFLAESVSAATGAFQVNEVHIGNSFGNWKNIVVGKNGDGNTNNNIFIVTAADADTGGGNVDVWSSYNFMQFAYISGVIALKTGSFYNEIYYQVGKAQCTFTDAGTGNLVRNNVEGTLTQERWETDGLSPLHVLQSKDAGAVVSDLVEYYRNSATPANNDDGGGIRWAFNNSSIAKTVTNRIRAALVSATAGAEYARLIVSNRINGAFVDVMSLYQGLAIGGAAADMGAGTVNVAAGYYLNGALIPADVPLLAGNTAAANAALLQAAINAASNATVYLPAGQFPMNAVTLKEGVRLQGRGKEVTRLLCGSNAINILQYTAAASTKFYFSICDIGFDVNGKTGATAIRLDGNTSAIRMSNVSLKNIEILGAFASGVYLKYCVASNLYDVYTALAVNGITIDNCADTDMLGCKAQNGTGAGFNIIGGAGAFDEGIRMVACSTNGQAIGISINGQDWGDMSACSFTTCTSGALITVGTVSNWKIAACDFAVAGGAPAQPNLTLTTGCVNWSITGCQFVLGTFGAIIRGTDHTIAGNTFFANSNVDIYVDGATGCSVTGNVCKSSTAAQSILEIAPANNNIIANNKCAVLQVKVGANSLITSDSSGAAVFTGALLPSANDGAALGAATVAWSDGFFANGAVLNFNNGNYTVTHSAGTLTLSGVLIAGNLGVTSAALPINGMYQQAATVLGFAANNTAILRASTTSFRPETSGGLTLGASVAPWSDTFIKSTGKIDFGSGDTVVTHSAATLTLTGSWVVAGNTLCTGLIASTGTGGVGYFTGAGGAVTQITSRTTGVTLNKTSGDITMFSAAGSATAASFTVTNSTVGAKDTISISQLSGTNKYVAIATAVAAGSFEVTFFTTGGTAVDAPVLHYNVVKGVNS